MGLKPENLKPAEGGAVAAELDKKLSRKASHLNSLLPSLQGSDDLGMPWVFRNTKCQVGEGTMYNPAAWQDLKA